LEQPAMLQLSMDDLVLKIARINICKGSYYSQVSYKPPENTNTT